MTPVYKLSASSIKGRTNYGSMLAGNAAYVPPSWFESIATVTVGSGGSATVSFTSIPATYTHLQVRMIGRSTNAGANITTGQITVNSTTSTNMAYHRLFGNGTAASAYAYADYSSWDDLLMLPQDGTTASVYSAAILDILDYANTNKNKTLRLLGGVDLNGSGSVLLGSGLVNSTTAISSITFATASTYKQYSHFALYGCKTA